MNRPTVLRATFCILFLGVPLSFGQTVSEEAKRHFDRGMAAVGMAESPDGCAASIAEFQQAIRLAPDWPDAHYNLGKVQELAGEYGDAITNLRQYLRLAPNASDARAVRTLINKLEYKADHLTTADVIDVLVSFSNTNKWETVKGRCIPQPFAFIRPKGGDSVSLPMAYAFPDGRPYTLKTVAIKGAICKMNTRNDYGVEDGSPIGFFCENEIKIVSRTYVKITQQVSRSVQFYPQSGGGPQPARAPSPVSSGTYSSEFRKLPIGKGADASPRTGSTSSPLIGR